MRRWAIVLVLAGCGRIGFDPASADDAGTDGELIPNPSHWWKLDEASGTMAADSVGSAHGNFIGTGQSWVPGQIDGALSFSGGVSNVRMGTHPSLANLPAVTVSLWLKPSSVSIVNGPHCVFDKGCGGSACTNEGGWAVLTSELSDGDLGFVAFASTVDARRMSVPNVLAVDQWTHVVVTWDGSMLGAGMQLYRDGIETTYLVTADSAAARPSDATITAAINCNAPTSFAGVIDDVKLFDRVLSPSQVARL